MRIHSKGRAWILVEGDFAETCARFAGRVDLVACSPPYCDARTYGRETSWGDADYARLGDAVWAALKPGGHALINVDAPVREWRSGKGTERGFHPWRLMLDWAERVGFRVPDRLAFGRMGLPGAYLGRFRNDWEPLLWFQKPGDGYFNRWPLALPAKYGRDYGATTLRGRGKDGKLTFRPYSGQAAKERRTHRGSLWDYGPVGRNQSGAPDIEAANHPARWPYRLAEDIVRCFCSPDGVVLDPFVGAGTTVAAAIAHGRLGIGGDLDASWLDKAAPILRAREEALS